MKLKKHEIRRLISETITRVLAEGDRTKTFDKSKEDIDIDDLEKMLLQKTNSRGGGEPPDQDDSLDIEDAPELGSSQQDVSRRNFLKGLAGIGGLSVSGAVVKGALDSDIGGVSVSALNKDIAEYIRIFAEELGGNIPEIYIDRYEGLSTWSKQFPSLKSIIDTVIPEVVKKIANNPMTLNQMGDILYSSLLPAIQHTLVNEVLPAVEDPALGLEIASSFYVTPSLDDNAFLIWSGTVFGEALYGIFMYSISSSASIDFMRKIVKDDPEVKKQLIDFTKDASKLMQSLNFPPQLRKSPGEIRDDMMLHPVFYQVFEEENKQSVELWYRFIASIADNMREYDRENPVQRSTAFRIPSDKIKEVSDTIIYRMSSHVALAPAHNERVKYALNPDYDFEKEKIMQRFFYSGYEYTIGDPNDEVREHLEANYLDNGLEMMRRNPEYKTSFLMGQKSGEIQKDLDQFYGANWGSPRSKELQKELSKNRDLFDSFVQKILVNKSKN